MGKAARIKERHRVEAQTPAAQPRTEAHSKGNRRTRRARTLTQHYAFHRPGTPKPARPSAAPWMTHTSKAAALRNGVSRGAPGQMRRRNDPRDWTREPERGSRRAAWRARWTPGAIFRSPVTGKKYVDLDKVEDAQKR